MKELSVIVLCNDRIALPALQALAFHGQLAAIGIPDRNKEMIEEIREILTEVPILLLKKREWKNQLVKLFTDTGSVVGLLMTFPWKLEKDLIGLPARGFFNFHYGTLPKYRGTDPIFSQIKNRESFAGLTIHKVEEKMDAGAVVMLEKIQLKPDTTYGILKNKLSQVGAVMVLNLLKIMSFSEKLPARVQDETQAQWFDRPSAKDVMIRWKEMDSETIIATINACNPWNKGAGTVIKGLGIRILEAELVPGELDEKFTSGTIVLLNSGGIEVATVDHRILRLNFIYTTEAFMSASRLAEFGIKQGDSFD